MVWGLPVFSTQRRGLYLTCVAAVAVSETPDSTHTRARDLSKAVVLRQRYKATACTSYQVKQQQQHKQTKRLLDARIQQGAGKLLGERSTTLYDRLEDFNSYRFTFSVRL